MTGRTQSLCVAGQVALGLALSVAGSGALYAQESAQAGGADIFSADSFTVLADVRLVGVSSEPGWVEGGFGKVRFEGADASGKAAFRVKPTFAEADIVWQPRFAWALSGTVVGQVQGGDALQAGLSEAYLSWKPLSAAPIKVSARAGLMWPPVSLEHAGPEWAVRESITPSAINSWMGEEVKVVGAEVSAAAAIGAHRLALSGALFDGNDTAGALLAFRGWALHDRKGTPWRAQALPPLNAFLNRFQPPYSHPVIEMDGGFLKRPGYYARLAWDLPLPLHVEAVHYDNGSDPKSFNAEMEWGWRTRFDNIGLVAQPFAGTQLRAQAMSGTTRMGYAMPVSGPGSARVDWIDMRFRSAFAMLTHYFTRGSASARIEAFGTRNHGSALTGTDDEDGWSAMIAARREMGPHLSALAEILHVESRRDARIRAGLAPDQASTQMQLSLRARW